MSILIENRQKKINVDLKHVKKVLRNIMNYLNWTDREISLLLVDDHEIRKMNTQYLNRDYSTNVLTFSLSEGEFGDINPKVLGDIVISVETALKDADEAGIELNDELEFLMIHGMLHLLNYNHENVGENEVKKMERKEQEVLSILKK